MRVLGIIGGIAPESTVEYYRLLIAGYRERVGDGGYPPIIINSIDLKRLLDLIGAGRLAEVTDYLSTEVERLARAGATVALFASNTPHLVFDDLQRRSPIPLISIVDATADAAQAIGLAKVGLFGTRFTMQGSFYPETLAGRGIAVVTPGPDDQTYIHDKYMTELVPGIFLPATRDRFLDIVRRLKQSNGIEALILGGTELPLLLRDSGDTGIPFLDTTRIHVERALTAILSEAPA